MADAARAQSLYEHIERLPEGMVGEIINGQLHTHPRPSGPHVNAASLLLADIVGPFYRGHGDGPGGWRILGEPELHLQRNTEVLVPDIAGWRSERLPAIPDDQRFEVVPDWVCEILSVSTEGVDRELKMPVYARYGVQHAWLVDPRGKTVECYCLKAGEWALFASFSGEEPIRAAPFGAVDIPPPWSGA
jgi:Uma2 family endonuclease